MHLLQLTGLLLVASCGSSAQLTTIPTSEVDDLFSEGSLAWSDNGLMSLFPILPWDLQPRRRSHPDLSATCPRVPILIGGKVDSASYPYRVSYAHPYDSVTFACNRGHFMRGTAEITCMPNGNWSSIPRCVSMISSPSFRTRNRTSDNEAVWLTSPPRSDDELVWPEWFTTIFRSYSVTPEPVAGLRRLSEQPLSTTPAPRLFPFIIRIRFNLDGLFSQTTPADRIMELLDGPTTTEADDGILSDRAVYIGIIVGACAAGLLIFGLTIFFLLRIIRKLAKARADESNSARPTTATKHASSSGNGSRNFATPRPEDLQNSLQHPNAANDSTPERNQVAPSGTPPPTYRSLKGLANQA